MTERLIALIIASTSGVELHGAHWFLGLALLAGAYWLNEDGASNA